MPTDFRLDTHLLDALPLDGEPSTPAVPTDDIWYNYFGLQNENICVEYVRVSAPSLEQSQRGYPRANGLYTESAQWRQNRIKLRGTIKADSQTELETLMDDMRKAFAFFGGTLRIKWAGVVRYYDQCYPTNLDAIFDSREYYNVDWVTFEIEFSSEQPFARSGNREITDAPYPITASPTNFVIANSGTAQTDPIISLTVITAGSLSSIQIECTTNNDLITIAHAYSDGDALEIDGENKTVKINGVEVDYTGVIPRAESGNNTFTITTVGGSYSIAFSEQHYSRYY